MKLRYAIKAANFKKSVALLLVTLLFATSIAAQTTAFTYQGKLAESGNPPTGTFQMQFKLFDAVTAGNQIGSTIDNPSVAVNQGIFSVSLNFGVSAFGGADRYLEISVRHNSGESYTTLSPRQQIASSPYSIRTLSAQQADVALDANKLGGVDASQYVTNATLSTLTIRNQTSQQANSNFNISGNGLIGGNVGVGTTTPTSKLDVRGNLTLDNGGDPVIYTGTAAEQNRFLSLINSSASPSASGLKAGGILVADSFNYANPGKNNLVVKGNVGIGTPAPNGKLEVVSDWDGSYGALTLRGDRPTIRFSGGAVTGNQQWLIHQSSINAGSLQFFNGGTTGNFVTPMMSLSPNGNVGIGTPSPSQLLHINNNSGNAAALVQTPTNAFAQYQLQSGATNPWIIGTQDNYFSNSLIFRNGSTNLVGIYPDGTILQAQNANGLPKAMVYVNGDGTILRCYNGLTGSSTGNCGFTAARGVFPSGDYVVNFGFQVSSRFWSATVNGGCCAEAVSVHVAPQNSTSNSLEVYVFNQNADFTDRPVMLIVY